MKAIKTFIAICAIVLSASEIAGATECTNLDKAHWIKQNDMQKILSDRGYKVINLELSGDCYKVHMEAKDGKQLEGIYNPVGGHPMKRKVK